MCCNAGRTPHLASWTYRGQSRCAPNTCLGRQKLGYRNQNSTRKPQIYGHCGGRSTPNECQSGRSTPRSVSRAGAPQGVWVGQEHPKECQSGRSTPRSVSRAGAPQGASVGQEHPKECQSGRSTPRSVSRAGAPQGVSVGQTGFLVYFAQWWRLQIIAWWGGMTIFPNCPLGQLLARKDGSQNKTSFEVTSPLNLKYGQTIFYRLHFVFGNLNFAERNKDNLVPRRHLALKLNEVRQDYLLHLFTRKAASYLNCHNNNF
jgi:hypothetical protein